jgi:hypothetical protein
MPVTAVGVRGRPIRFQELKCNPGRVGFGCVTCELMTQAVALKSTIDVSVVGLALVYCLQLLGSVARFPFYLCICVVSCCSQCYKLLCGGSVSIE